MNAAMKENPLYWSTYFAMRIACVLHEVKSKQVRQSLRDDLHEYLRTSVAGEESRNTIQREMRR